ncbi:hypothetical protein LTR53_014915 [Teratosphaeriaceae sp. CCFEE 6253]|nr:hypothetical protein LTR53_014915 [Teratosphaeriaceae sp. CCFEE 6253]
MTQSMKDALKGSGGGIQGLTQAIGDTYAQAQNPQTAAQRGATEASASLQEFAGQKGSGATTAGTSISGADQVKNQQTGSADHLDMGLRKD